MAGELVVLDGSTFFVSDEAGDVRGGAATGFFFQDVRHLARWILSVNGAPMRVLTSRVVDYYSARVYGTLPTARLGLNPPISIQRDRIVGGGVHEDLWVRNHSEEAQTLRLELEFGSDFADIFELKVADRAPVGETRVESGDGSLTIWHERRDVRRGTRLTWRAPGQVTDDAIPIRDRAGAPRRVGGVSRHLLHRRRKRTWSPSRPRRLRQTRTADAADPQGVAGRRPGARDRFGSRPAHIPT